MGYYSGELLEEELGFLLSQTDGRDLSPYLMMPARPLASRPLQQQQAAASGTTVKGFAPTAATRGRKRKATTRNTGSGSSRKRARTDGLVIGGQQHHTSGAGGEGGGGGGGEESGREVKKEDVFCALAIGRSQSGKTKLVSLLARRFSRKYGKPVYIVNERGASRSGFKRVEWEKLHELSNCCLIIDDLVGATDEELQQCRELLDVSWHHRKCNPIFIVAHCITKTGCSNLLQHVNRMYISAVQTSFESLAYALTKFGFDESEKEIVNTRLRSGKIPPFSFFLLDIDQRKIEVVNFGREALEEESRLKTKEEEERRERESEVLKTGGQVFATLIASETERAKASLILQILLGRLLDQVDPLDVSMKVTRRACGKECSISLIDYVCCLLSEELEDLVGEEKIADLKQLHTHIAKNRTVVIPNVLIRNRRFSRLQTRGKGKEEEEKEEEEEEERKEEKRRRIRKAKRRLRRHLRSGGDGELESAEMPNEEARETEKPSSSPAEEGVVLTTEGEAEMAQERGGRRGRKRRRREDV
jgi:hypothetical protein